MDPHPPPRHPVVLFDGTCGFCDRSVLFILTRDRRGRFRFAPLESAAGRRLLQSGASLSKPLDSLVLVEGNRRSTRSTAALRVLRELPFPWSWLYGLIVVPRPIRDFVYNAIARRRRWFGEVDTCSVSPQDQKARFLTVSAEAQALDPPT